MFPNHLLKNPYSLQDLSENVFRKWLISFIRGPPNLFWREVAKVRRHIRRRLSAEVRSNFLSTLIPSDRWRRPCLASQDRIRCIQHEDCKIVYEDCDKLVELLFSPDATFLTLNLKRIMNEHHGKIIERISTVIQQVDFMGHRQMNAPHCPRLTVLILSGGTSHTDMLVKKIDELCHQLSQHAPELQRLHLPVMSNTSAKHISSFTSLISLRSDRTREFDERGLRYLSSEDSATRNHLQFFHIGVYKHKRFDKLDVARFFVQMSALKNISFMDDNRALVQMTEQFGKNIGDKVLTYSVLRLAIVSAYSGNLQTMIRRCPEGHFTLNCKLVDILVVDRELKPKYLLESCPDLKRLSIEWQHELSQPPYLEYHQEWFTRMLQKPEWPLLASKLSHLNIKFPSTDSLLGYSLPLTDFSRLLANSSTLTSLRLVGAGRNGDPIPILHILWGCPQLQELHLEKCRIYFPDVCQHYEISAIHQNLRKFRFLSDHVSLKWHPYFTRCITIYMPKLVELEIQPLTAAEFEGYPLERLFELSPLADLVRLSLPLSLNSCIMNMPEVVLILTEFKSLRSLVLSWGMFNMSNMSGRIQYLLSWLKNALKAGNANITVQLDYARHPNLYQANFSRPS